MELFHWLLYNTRVYKGHNRKREQEVIYFLNVGVHFCGRKIIRGHSGVILLFLLLWLTFHLKSGRCGF